MSCFLPPHLLASAKKEPLNTVWCKIQERGGSSLGRLGTPLVPLASGRRRRLPVNPAVVSAGAESPL